jgi:hypothetical protein
MEAVLRENPAKNRPTFARIVEFMEAQEGTGEVVFASLASVREQ